MKDLEFGTLNAPSSKRQKQAFDDLQVCAKPCVVDAFGERLNACFVILRQCRTYISHVQVCIHVPQYNTLVKHTVYVWQNFLVISFDRGRSLHVPPCFRATGPLNTPGTTPRHCHLGYTLLEVIHVLNTAIVFSIDTALFADTSNKLVASAHRSNTGPLHDLALLLHPIADLEHLVVTLFLVLGAGLALPLPPELDVTEHELEALRAGCCHAEAVGVGDESEGVLLVLIGDDKVNEDDLLLTALEGFDS